MDLRDPTGRTTQARPEIYKVTVLRAILVILTMAIALKLGCPPEKQR